MKEPIHKTSSVYCIVLHKPYQSHNINVLAYLVGRSLTFACLRLRSGDAQLVSMYCKLKCFWKNLEARYNILSLVRDRPNVYKRSNCTDKIVCGATPNRGGSRNLLMEGGTFINS